jgi:hypothetical protein
MQGDEIARHRGLGITSFILAIVVLLGVFTAMAVAGVTTINGTATPTSKTLVGIGLLFLLLLDVVAIALGIAGLVDRTSKKTFPVLGITLCAGTLVLTGAVIAIGVWAKHS